MKDRKLVILYGSQGGTAQDIAERLWRESKCFEFTGPVLPMDEYDAQNLICESVAIFVCSTTGQGEQPDNMKKFWRFLLRKSLPSNSLTNLRYAVLGLGDSSYAKYNYVGKKLYRRLLNLGAVPLCELGLADDQHDLGIDGVVDPWIRTLWTSLLEYLPLSGLHIGIIDEKKPLPPRWIINELREIKNGLKSQLSHDCLLRENSSLTVCMQNERVTTREHFQDVRLMKFNLTEQLSYSPGDVLMVRPMNSEESVDEFFKLFSERKEEIHRNVVISVQQRFPDMPVPYQLRNPVRLEVIVREFWDLNIVPRRYVFDLLAHFTDNELEKEKLTEFISPEGQQDLYDYCNRPKRTVLEVLADFLHATANIPLQYLFEVFTPIRPRAFSIASSPKAHPGEIHILVAVVKYRTNLKKPRIGLCSTWLSYLKAGDIIPVHIKEGSFTFPADKSVPVIMIGPGTGIAPFRSFVHEDVQDDESTRLLYVYFGCRHKNTDYYFKEEWTFLQTTGRVFVYTAFSRDQPEKVYVQDLLERSSNLVWKLLSNSKTCIFVAGNAKNMPNAVRNTFIKILQDHRGVSNDDAEKYVEQMELTGRYQTETWS